MAKTKTIKGKNRMPQTYSKLPGWLLRAMAKLTPSNKPAAEMRGRAKRELVRRQRSAPTISRVIRRV